MKKVAWLALVAGVLLSLLTAIPADADTPMEWSDIPYVQGMYSRYYFDYVNSTFHFINDWAVDQADGGIMGGLNPGEYNRFNFAMGGNAYEIRIYPNGTGSVWVNGAIGSLPGFQSATSWATSPNWDIEHTIWEFRFQVAPMVQISRFAPCDPPGPAVPTYVLVPVPSPFTTGPSIYPHYTDGFFADLQTPAVLPPDPARDYQDPVEDPAWHDITFDLTFGESGNGITVTPVVPEPGSLLALGSGLIGLSGMIIRRRR